MTYVLVNKDSICPNCIDNCVETSINSLRYSLDGEKILLKYHEKPTCCSLCDGVTEYTHAEILEELATEDWTPPLPE